MDTVAAMMDAQLWRAPDATAVIDGDRRLTYRELHERANHVARSLAAHGVKRETRVGVCCERTAEMIVAVVAIVKAGAVYVPIDPAYPPARRDALVADAGLAAVVTQRHLAQQFAIPSVCADEAGGAAAAPAVALRGDDAMLVLYTSGSTGQPRGVACTHAAVASRLRWQQDVYPFAPGEIASARTTLNFVDSVAEIFAPLAFGVPLVVFVPSLLAAMLDVMPDLAERAPALRYWFVGGEPVPVPLVERFRRALPGRKLINIYGATELTADATYYDFDAMPAGLATAPIGVPLPGVFARVVDPQLREVPDAETGEVVISGVCLARGYLGRDDLTAERFVANPFPEGGRLYRTRDVGRRLASGDLQYLGRLDQLVKIRGFRVELGEVEAVVGAAPGVAHAVAIARDDQLIAFYVGERELPAVELRAFVMARVPMYAVPNRFVWLAAFRVNANGKVDRAALAALPLATGAAGAPPATDDESRVAAVWREILGHDAIGRDQDFFDLGGTSLAAMRVVARLRDRHGVDLPVAVLFDAPTIAALAPRLATARSAAARRPLIATARRPLVATDRPI